MIVVSRNTIEFLAIPDQVHNNERDYGYFAIDDFFCISSYEQIATAKIREKSKDVTRATIQKSLVYFSKTFNYTPLGLSYFRAKMQEAVHAYFAQAQQGSFSDKSTLEAFYNQIPSILTLITSPTADIPENKFLRASPVLRLLSRFGRNALSLLKLFLLEKKVVIYGIPVGETCDIIVALTSLLPLHNEKHDQLPFIRESSLESLETDTGALTDHAKNELLKPVQYNTDELEYSTLKLPLRVAPFTFISGNVALNQADWLCGQKSFFIGTSNALFSMNRQVLELDATFDATTAQFTMHAPGIANALKLTPEDAAFIDFVINKVANGGATEDVSAPENSKRIHDDPFADFLIVDAESESSSKVETSIGTFTSTSTAKSMASATYTPGTAVAWQSKESWVRTMFARYVKALLAGVSTQVTGVTQSRVDAYGGHFLLDWQTTRNYRFWRTQIDVRLLHADPTYNNMSHPGFALPTSPSTLMGKSIQTVKGSLNTISSTTSSFVSSLGNAWNSRTASNTNNSNPNNVWGMDFGASHSPEPLAASSSAPASAAPSSPSSAQSQSAASVSIPINTPEQQQQPPQGTPTRGGFSGFFESVKQKMTSPFAKTDRAAAQFEPVVLDGRAPTVVQPAQLASPLHASPASQQAPRAAPSNTTAPTAPQQQNQEEEDLLGF